MNRYENYRVEADSLNNGISSVKSKMDIKSLLFNKVKTINNHYQSMIRLKKEITELEGTLSICDKCGQPLKGRN